MIILYSHLTTINGPLFSVYWIQNIWPGCQGPLIIWPYLTYFVLISDMSSTPIMLVSFLRRMYENTRFLLVLLLTYSQGKQISCFGFSFHSASLNSTYLLSYGTISNSFMKTSPIYCSNWPIFYHPKILTTP